MIVPLSVLKTVTSVTLCSQKNWEWYVLNRLHGENFISYKVYTVLQNIGIEMLVKMLQIIKKETRNILLGYFLDKQIKLVSEDRLFPTQ